MDIFGLMEERKNNKSRYEGYEKVHGKTGNMSGGKIDLAW